MVVIIVALLCSSPPRIMLKQNEYSHLPAEVVSGSASGLNS